MGVGEMGKKRPILRPGVRQLVPCPEMKRDRETEEGCGVR